MSPLDEDKTPLDDWIFDQLADGELEETDRRELLAQLDTTPDGWRRCALAFLEGQSLRQELRALAASQRAVSTAVAARPAARSRGWRQRAAAMANLAAGFLIAITLVFLVREYSGPSAPAPGAVAVTGAEGASGSTAATAAASQISRSPSGGWQTVTLAPDAGAQQFVHLPVNERATIDEDWLKALPEAIPDDILRALERTGHRVERQRQLLPVPLEDGRQLVVPVDQVEIRYVGNSAYQ